MVLAQMAKAFKLKYQTPTNNNQRISSSPRNRHIAQPGMNIGQDRQMQMVGGIANQNSNMNGNLVAARAEGNATGHNGIQLQAEEFDLISTTTDLDEIEEINANYGSAEVYNYENCYDNEIFYMFTQEEQYTELLEPIPEPHQVSDQKDTACGMSVNTKFAKESILRKPPKVGETHVLSKPVTTNLIPTPQGSKVVKNVKVIQICLWCVDSGCSKHMTGNLKLLINFVWKFLGTVRFRNDHIAAILGFSDLQWGNILITRVYFVEGLGHNLFLVGQFCYLDLEIAFRRNTCFIRNLEGVDLLKGIRTTNLYTSNLHEMASASPIHLMARASYTKSWLWNQRLSYLNFDTINDLAKNDLVSGLPKFKYHKEHLCSSCEQGKSKRASHPPKPVPYSRQRLHLLHMDLCGPMGIASINGKRYVLVIVDDYSRYTWV
nr:retrovirus-related Pol polyprotein from transposon TNT 1-94 [Tanacetum cinerariifolium]